MKKLLKSIKKNTLWLTFFAVFLSSIFSFSLYVFGYTTNLSQKQISRVENLEDALHIKETTTKNLFQYFKNVNVNDVIAEISKKDSPVYHLHKKSIYIEQEKLSNWSENILEVNSIASYKNDDSLVYKEINQNLDFFRTITKDVLDGKLTAEIIKANLTTYKAKNPQKYQLILEEITAPIANQSTTDFAKTYLYNNFNNNFAKIPDITITDENNRNIKIPSDAIAYYTKLEKLTKRYTTYRDKLYGTAVASATLTAASWAIAAFYWAAWWMFGGNIPLAIAATAQASVSTVFTKQTFDEYYEVRDQVEEWNKIIVQKEFQDYKKLSERLFQLSQDKLSKSAINFSIKVLKHTTYVKLGSLVIKKFLNYVEKKFINKIFKNLLFKINSRVAKFIGNATAKKIIMKSLSWASPASTVISVLDTVLDICSFAADIAIFNPRELRSW